MIYVSALALALISSIYPVCNVHIHATTLIISIL
nr:MAG TPA: hypothetical protein [Caudoviricetes sp.]